MQGADPKLVEALNRASSLELFQLSTIIERMLGDPRRIIAVRTNTNLGQTARFLDWRDGQMCNGKVIAMKDPQVTLHEEGARRDWSIATTGFSGEGGRVKRLHAVRVERRTLADGRTDFAAVAGSELDVEADLVLLAMGFTGVVRSRLLIELGVALDGRGNVASDERFATSAAGIFAAGDARRGASLIVWAIREGRDVADSINAWLGSRR